MRAGQGGSCLGRELYRGQTLTDFGSSADELAAYQSSPGFKFMARPARPSGLCGDPPSAATRAPGIDIADRRAAATSRWYRGYTFAEHHHLGRGRFTSPSGRCSWTVRSSRQPICWHASMAPTMPCKWMSRSPTPVGLHATQC